jgi:hypothetical protein
VAVKSDVIGWSSATTAIQQLAVLTHLLVTVPGACVGCLLRSLPQMYCRQGDHKNLLIELNQILDGFSYHHRVISTAICILT